MITAYSYRGNLYTASSGVYNNDMSIKGQFTTTKLFEPHSSYEKDYFLDDANFTFSFSDGYNTYSSNDPHTYITELEGFEFTITTVDDAMPEFWFIFLRHSAFSAEDTLLRSEMSTGKDAREDASPPSFDYAKAERLMGEDSEEIGNGEVHSEGSWSTSSILNPPKSLRVF